MPAELARDVSVVLIAQPSAVELNRSALLFSDDGRRQMTAAFIRDRSIYSVFKDTRACANKPLRTDQRRPTFARIISPRFLLSFS
jgi:hypothetical protein